MDRFSALPFDLRKPICSYYFESNTDHLCTLNIAQGETEHSEASKDFSQDILQTALKLEEMTRTSTESVSGLLQEMKSKVSAFSATKKVEEWKKWRNPLRVLAILRHSHAIASLKRAADDLGVPIEIQPTESCRRFLNLAHVNRRMRGDLISTKSTYNISGDMKVFQKLLPKTSIDCRGLVVFVSSCHR